MNEVTSVHLGRQAFTISVEAHHALKAYLAAIEKQVKDKDVVNEVELRMAEILSEHGIVGEKVILLEDVDYLKQQLGNPTDFSDDEDDVPSKEQPSDNATKRLFRDTDNAMLAGVAAGIANYFGLDAVLIRILFVILTIFGGSGILIYIVLWLIVPPATTSSEKLQMKGMPVTIEALKESVNKADLSGAARRANKTVLPVINSLFKVLLKIIGIGFIATGLAVMFGLGAIKSYMLLHHGQLFQENYFPVGTREQWLMGLGMILVAITGLFSIIVGIATFKRKWPIRAWATGTLVGVFLIGSAASLALSADIAPRVRERYESSMSVSAVNGIMAFNNITTTGGLDIEYNLSPNYEVSLSYYGHPDISKIKITVTDNVLNIDSTAFDGNRHCTMLCLFPRYNLVVHVTAPNIQKFDLPRGTELFLSPPVAPI